MRPLKPRSTRHFRKDLKAAEKRGLDIDKLTETVKKLSNRETLPDSYQDHPLYGKWIGHRECHITPDWLLVYRIEETRLVLVLARTGTHSDIFKK